jgi:hypothetical protein
MKARQFTIIILLTLVLAAPVPAMAMSGKDDVPAAVHPVIREVKNDVTVKGVKYSVWEPAEERMLILSGDVIRTGDRSFARLEFLSGTAEIYKNSEVLIPSTGKMDRKKDILDMEMSYGKVRFDINPLGAQRQFTFRTGHSIGIVQGTRFVVKAGKDTTRVVVYEGSVAVTDKNGDAGARRTITRGQYMTMFENGSDSKVAYFDAAAASASLAAGIEPDVSDSGMSSAGDGDKDKSKGKGNHGAGQGKGKGNK